MLRDRFRRGVATVGDPPAVPTGPLLKSVIFIGRVYYSLVKAAVKNRKLLFLAEKKGPGRLADTRGTHDIPMTAPPGSESPARNTKEWRLYVFRNSRADQPCRCSSFSTSSRDVWRTSLPCTM